MSEEFTLETVVFNTGPGTAQNVVIDIQLDPSLIPNPFPGNICSAAGGVFSCELGDIAIGETATFDIFATAPGSPGLVTSQISASADNDDPFGGNDSDQATTLVVSSADVSVTIATAPTRSSHSTPFSTPSR